MWPRLPGRGRWHLAGPHWRSASCQRPRRPPTAGSQSCHHVAGGAAAVTPDRLSGTPAGHSSSPVSPGPDSQGPPLLGRAARRQSPQQSDALWRDRSRDKGVIYLVLITDIHEGVTQALKQLPAAKRGLQRFCCQKGLKILREQRGNLGDINCVYGKLVSVSLALNGVGEKDSICTATHALIWSAGVL